jgi:hypothetical protein
LIGNRGRKSTSGCANSCNRAHWVRQPRSSKNSLLNPGTIGSCRPHGTLKADLDWAEVCAEAVEADCHLRSLQETGCREVQLKLGAGDSHPHVTLFASDAGDNVGRRAPALLEPGDRSSQDRVGHKSRHCHHINRRRWWAKCHHSLQTQCRTYEQRHRLPRRSHESACIAYVQAQTNKDKSALDN